MSVLINMEMPTDCGHCRFAVDGWCYAYGKPNIDALANDGRANFCPLVPVLPHGRLIDVDKLPLEESVPTVMMHDGERWISAYELAMAPIVIPASEEGEG